MKKIFIACLLLIGFVFTVSAEDSAIISVDIVRVKLLALDAIKAKYPDIVPVNLQYTGMTANVATNDEVAIKINYLVCDSGKTENVEKNGFEMAKTKQATYVVEMDHLGKIKNVSTGQSISVQAFSRKNSANTPSDRTR